jgi:rfaE bifunctional protein kinase chain/domain
MTIPHIFDSFKNLKVLIIGDVMVDAYLWGTVERISPEAPVPIVNVEKKDARLGGAANVALNVAALGATPLICSIIGNDESGERFSKSLTKSGISQEGLVKSDNRPTTVKTRIFCQNHQMMRFDEESIVELNKTEESNLLENVENLFSSHSIDVVIFQDYNKGVLSKNVIEHVLEKCLQENIPTAVDPKKENFFAFQNVDLFKPNLREVNDSLHLNIDGNASLEDWKAAAKKIKST